MKAANCRIIFAFSLLTLLASTQSPRAQVLWTCGQDDNGWPMGTGGGANASFVQENGSVNALPGSPFSTSVPQGADNDYYFAGDYEQVIPGNGTYTPVGVVDSDEEAAERAITDGDILQRYHFNLPATMQQSDLLSVTFGIYNLDTSGGDARYGIEVLFNGVKVQDQIVIRPAQLEVPITTPQFSLADVNAQAGSGYDNIVTLQGVSYNAEGGGAWIGFDWIQLNHETTRIPQPVFPWAVGLDDNAWATGTGGGSNTTFVAASASANALPGSPTAADNDYYFAGLYTNGITGNGTYTPVGLVAANEAAAQGGFAGTNNDLRYHFNLPLTLQPSDSLSVTFDGLNLDTSGSDPRYGVEVYFNGVQVQSAVLIRAAQLDHPVTTPAFTLASVNAQTGVGPDNILTLHGINYSAAGGGNSLGLDFLTLNLATPIPPPVLPWSVGKFDNGWPTGVGGGINANFVQENGTVNPLPGNPKSPAVDGKADNDYYFAGLYSTVITNNGNYQPVGAVRANEEAAERALTSTDNLQRYHFNLPATVAPTDKLAVVYSALSLDTSAADPRWGVEVYFNNVLVQTQIVIRADQLNQMMVTPPFTPAQVNAQVGPGYDNIITLKGTSYSDGGTNMGLDFIELNAVTPGQFPWSVGRDDQGWPVGAGGGANATFVQENGNNNPLPGSPANLVADQKADDDYYLAGIYTNTIPSVVAAEGDYTPVGTVVVNEEAAERAFAGSSNTRRYHFNLPATLKSTDPLLVTFAFDNLDTSGTDPQYGFEVYFNDVQIQSEIVVHPANPANFDFDYTVGPVTLASVNAQPGPGWDNIVTLQGVNHSADGGGAWMGIDYIDLDPVPQPVFPWAVGKADMGWPAGTGGGPNANFVQENGTVNDLPGSAHNHPINQQADNDYYLAGVYTNVIAANGSYTPVGYVPRNEEAAERAVTPTDNVQRYHFNLPTTLNLTDKVAVTYGIYNLDTSVTNPLYGISVYFNGVLVQPEVDINTNLLGVPQTTPAFTLSSVNAQLGLGPDNIVSLQGIDHAADGGGGWMGFDYIQLNPASDNTPLKFLTSTASQGKLTLTWTGTGILQWAPAVTGSWTAVAGNPTSPYTEDIVPTQPGRFYRLQKP